MRSFLAIPVEEPALHQVQRTLAGLRRRVVDVRWARPETPHITLHFFGAIDAVDATRACAAASAVTPDVEPFRVVLDQLGAFPERGAPRVLWLGCRQPAAALATLAARLSAALCEAGFAVETRPFRAHCTLGRPRWPWPAPARDAWEAARDADHEARRFTARRLVLYESRSEPGGSVYTERASLSLGAG